MSNTTKSMDTYTACSIIEGFADGPTTPRDELEAWAYLIKTGHAWTLQGFYGRTARAIIEDGLINKDGTVPKSSYERLGE